MVDFWPWLRHSPFQTMAQHPKPSAKNETGEYANFEAALKKVISVPHSELKSRLDSEKRAKKRRGKQASARASRERV
jgi:hypothetical protein